MWVLRFKSLGVVAIPIRLAYSTSFSRVGEIWRLFCSIIWGTATFYGICWSWMQIAFRLVDFPYNCKYADSWMQITCNRVLRFKSLGVAAILIRFAYSTSFSLVGENLTHCFVVQFEELQHFMLFVDAECT